MRKANPTLHARVQMLYAGGGGGNAPSPQVPKSRPNVCVLHRQAVKDMFGVLRKRMSKETIEKSWSGFPKPDELLADSGSSSYAGASGRISIMIPGDAPMAVVAEKCEIGVKKASTFLLGDGTVRPDDAVNFALFNVVSVMYAEGRMLMDLFGSTGRRAFTDALEAIASENASSNVVLTADDDISSETLSNILDCCFSEVVNELKSLVELACERDPFFAIVFLRMLQVFSIAYSGTSSGMALVQTYIINFLAPTSWVCMGVFNQYVDSVLVVMVNDKPATKRAGIFNNIRRLGYFLAKLLLCSGQLDMMGVGVLGGASAVGNAGALTVTAVADSRDALFQSITKTINTSFKWLDDIAASNKKYTDVLKMENYHYFARIMNTYNLKHPGLVDYINKAQDNYSKSYYNYIRWILNDGVGKVLTFFDNVRMQKEQLDPAEVAFQPGVTRKELRALLAKIKSTMNQDIKEMHTRMDKHLCDEEKLLIPCWTGLSDLLTTAWSEADGLVSACYPGETLSPTGSELSAMLKAQVVVSPSTAK